jgi:glutamyl-tRNA synthetase
VGPYRQSDRLELYRARAQSLLEAGTAYYCFCTPEMLEADRKAALDAGRPPRYSGTCRTEDPARSRARVMAGESAAIRFATPDSGDVTFTDLVRGDITVSTDIIGDSVLVRSTGVPAYNFAVVVDDVEMAITHVIRGEDHISNTSRQVLLYEAMGAAPPAFGHLSLVLGPDHAPLSKRHGATSVAEFRVRGYLPEALVNYLALLGWSPGQDQEILPLADMATRFDLATVSHSAAVFDTAKLAWMNRHYMKEAAPGRIARDAMPYLVKAGALADTAAGREYLESIVPMVLGSVDRLEEIPDRAACVFQWSEGQAAALVAQETDGPVVARQLADVLATAGPLNRDSFRAAAKLVGQATGLKGRALFHPIRSLLTAAESGPELDLAVPAIDSGARLPVDAVFAPIKSCATRAAAVVAYLDQGPRT